MTTKIGNVSNLVLGAGILAGVGLVLYLGWKGKEKTEAAAGYLFGADQSRTLGTDIFDWLQGEPVFTSDPDQQLATCRALYPSGSGKVPKPGGVCERLLKDQNGVLTLIDEASAKPGTFID